MVDVDVQNIFELFCLIEEFWVLGCCIVEFDGQWWYKILGLFLVVLMLLFGVIVVFGFVCLGQLLICVIIGMVFGFVYFVVDNVVLVMGNFGGYLLLIVVWVLFLLFVLLGEIVLVCIEEQVCFDYFCEGGVL